MSGLAPVLLIEDNPKDVELMVRTFSDGHVANDIVVAKDGEQALDYLFRRGAFAGRDPTPPVLVLLDLNMPKLNGWEVLDQIRNDQTLKSLRVVILVSSESDIDRCSDMQNPLNVFAFKPIDLGILLGSNHTKGIHLRITAGECSVQELPTHLRQ